MDAKLKLSEAIRKGIERRDETDQGYYSTGTDNHPTRHSDAIGAALEGAGLVNPDVMTATQLCNFGFHEAHELLIGYWGKDPIETTHLCPVEGCQFAGELHDVIDHLTDIHRWKREQIAQWLESRGL